ncbi:MAG: hypothetical protein ACXVBE_13675, partial [Bdellovibrionota bacterium]
MVWIEPITVTRFTKVAGGYFRTLNEVKRPGAERKGGGQEPGIIPFAATILEIIESNSKNIHPDLPHRTKLNQSLTFF